MLNRINSTPARRDMMCQTIGGIFVCVGAVLVISGGIFFERNNKYIFTEYNYALWGRSVITAPYNQGDDYPPMSRDLVIGFTFMASGTILIVFGCFFLYFGLKGRCCCGCNCCKKSPIHETYIQEIPMPIPTLTNEIGLFSQPEFLTPPGYYTVQQKDTKPETNQTSKISTRSSISEMDNQMLYPTFRSMTDQKVHVDDSDIDEAK